MSREQEIAQLKTTLTLDTGNFKKQLTSVSKETNNLKRSFDIANKSIENAEDKVEATTKALSKGETAIESMNKKLQMQKQRYDDLKSTIDKQSKAYNELTEELSEAEKELESLKNAENKSTEAIEKQQKAIDELRKKLQDKAQLIDKNINNLQRYSNDIDKTESDITGLSKELNKLKESLNDTAEATESAFSDNSSDNLSQFKDLASDAGINLGLLELGAKGAALALAVVITKSVINGAINYDKAITDLQITMGITEDSAKDLYSAIRDIADGGYSIEGISEAVKMLEQRFGLSAEQSSELAQGIDLLNKYGYESKDVVRFMTSAVNDWGMSYEEALDYILKGHQEGLNMSEDWMDTLVEYTPIFSTLGIEGNDAFVLIQKAMQATGVDSDKAADMVKEFFLTLTDGSDGSKEAFEELGLNIDTLKKQIDDGSITSSEAMQKVMKAIMGVGDETEQARLLQEIFKGTIEYGSVGIVEAWANVGNEVVNTTGTIDAAKEAFEGSYEAAKQDLSNSWSDLTETLGSKVVPALTWTVDLLNDIAITALNIGPLTKNMFLEMGNDITQWSLGAIGKFQEFQIACIEGAIKIAEAMGKDEWASKWTTSLESVKQKHTETVEKIKKNEQERARIESEDQALRDEIYGRDKKNHNDTADSIIEDNKNVKQSNQETNKNLRTETENSAKTVSDKSKQMSKDLDESMKNVQASAKEGMGGVKVAVDDGTLSFQGNKEAATDMYLGVKTSFFKMQESATADSNLMRDNAKQAATDMYLGITTSTSTMADKAIQDWKRIRTEYSKSITGEITITTTNKTINETINKSSGQSRSNIEVQKNLIDNVSRIDVSPYDLTSGYYTPNTQASRSVIKINKDINSLSSLESKFDKLIDALSNSKSINQNNNINITAQEPLSPSQVAYNTRKELERLGRRL